MWFLAEERDQYRGADRRRAVGPTANAKEAPESGFNLRIAKTGCNDYATCAQKCGAMKPDDATAEECFSASQHSTIDADKLKFAKRGCELNSPRACAFMAAAFFTGGWGATEDRAQALKLGTSTCESAVPNAEHEIEKLSAIACFVASQVLYFDRNDGKRALALAERGCPTETKSCRMAAEITLNGKTMAPDKARGRSYVNAACKAGDKEMCDFLNSPAVK